MFINLQIKIGCILICIKSMTNFNVYFFVYLFSMHLLVKENILEESAGRASTNLTNKILQLQFNKL